MRPVRLHAVPLVAQRPVTRRNGVRIYASAVQSGRQRDEARLPSSKAKAGIGVRRDVLRRRPRHERPLLRAEGDRALRRDKPPISRSRPTVVATCPHNTPAWRSSKASGSSPPADAELALERQAKTARSASRPTPAGRRTAARDARDAAARVGHRAILFAPGALVQQQVGISGGFGSRPSASWTTANSAVCSASRTRDEFRQRMALGWCRRSRLP